MRPTLRSLVGLIFILSAVAAADLRVGFYDSTCPQAESLVLQAVHQNVDPDPTEAGWILRLYFHDCFYNGCDASLIIDSTPDGHISEWRAPANKGLLGTTIIDDAKRLIEAVCPQTVSCADILALAARDAVAISSKGAVNYSLPTGRRDSLTSSAEGVVLPDANMTIAVVAKMFSERNFTLEEMVTLLGAHSIGNAHCDFFRYRMFHFTGQNGTSDPNMDSTLKDNLMKLCGPVSNKRRVGDVVIGSDVNVNLDQVTPTTLDNMYYQLLLAKKAVLQIDQELAFDKSTAWLVESYASNATLFYQKFAEALVKMGSLGVLTGNEGEIRTRCGRFNIDKRPDKRP